MEYLPLISLVANVALPPLINLFKGIFKIQDNPENVLATLATSKPEVLPQYMDAQAKLILSQVSWFQRDVTGSVSQWVTNFRAVIRPTCVAVSLIILILSFFIKVEPQILICTNGIIGNWIGAKIEFHQ